MHFDVSFTKIFYTMESWFSKRNNAGHTINIEFPAPLFLVGVGTQIYVPGSLFWRYRVFERLNPDSYYHFVASHCVASYNESPVIIQRFSNEGGMLI